MLLTNIVPNPTARVCNLMKGVKIIAHPTANDMNNYE